MLRSGAALGVGAVAGCIGGGESDGFTGALASNASTFDPAAATSGPSLRCIDLLYEPLVGYDFDLNLRPVLARDWEQIDETTFAFYLREGVQFHTGEELTAEDVRFSVERYQGTPNESVVDGWYESSTVRGDYEIEFDLQSPYAPFLDDLWSVQIVPEGTESPEGRSSPLNEESRGTGPFRFESWSRDDRFVATRFEDYWWQDAGDGDLPGTAPIEEVNLRVIVDRSAQLGAVRSGDVDMIGSVPPRDVPDVEDDDDLTLTRTGGVTVDFLVFPVGVGPFRNPRFRRGITRLIPRDAVVGDAVFNGTATKSGTPYPPALGEPYWDEQFEERILEEYVGEDPDEAADLLDRAFDEEGIEPPYELRIRTSRSPVRTRWCQAIQAALDDTEYFDASVESMEGSTFVEYITERAHRESDVVALGWTASADPNSFLYHLLSSDQRTPDGYNINHYASEELDQLIEQGQRTFDDRTRAETYREIAERLAREVPVAFLWHGSEIDAVRSDAVDGWRTHPSASASYSAIYKPYYDQAIEYDG